MRTERTVAVLVSLAVLLAGSAVLLVAIVEPAWGAFAGTNGRIALASDRDGDYDIYTQRPGGSDLRRVTDAPGNDSAPDWSPDGTKLAFQSDRDGDLEIYVKDLASGQVTRLTDNAEDPDAEEGTKISDFSPAWSPDGTRIAFATSRDSNSESVDSVYVMNSDGSDERSLAEATSDQSCDPHPTWSPDGARVAYSAGQEGLCDIYAVDADGTNVRNLTNDPFRSNFSPEWSSGGRKIAWEKQTETDGPTDIWKMNANGSDKQRLTRAPASEETPAFAPDGRKIVFARNGDLFKMRSDGTNKTRIVRTPTVNEQEPDWVR